MSNEEDGPPWYGSMTYVSDLIKQLPITRPITVLPRSTHKFFPEQLIEDDGSNTHSISKADN